uniref:PUM-HD domain-containing protein n=1 Tax=Alexandrium monilatum TaxID=311494 RepID=A0A7S4PXU3_9DINO
METPPQRSTISNSTGHIMAPWMAHADPYPARAIRLRLGQAVEQPSWFCYLPQHLQQEHQCRSETCTTTVETPSSMQDGSVANGVFFKETGDALPSGTRTPSPLSERGLPVCGVALQPIGCVVPIKGFALAPSPADACGAWSPGSGSSHAAAAQPALQAPAAWAEASAPAAAATGTAAMPPLWAGRGLPPPAAAAGSGSAPAAGRAAGRTPAAASVAGRLWRLAQDAVGCQEVQRAFEEAAGDEERASLAAELRGHVWEALRCPHANYVLQKCIVTSSPRCSQFVIDELAWKGRASVSQAARHCFGCRIVERLLERCPPEQVEGLAEALLDDALALSAHRYGNYVVQHLLVHGSPAQQRRLAGLLAESAHSLGANCYTSAVLIKALSWGPQDGQVLLARALLSVPGLFSTMARTRHGRLAAKLVLKVLQVPGELDSAVKHLTTEAASFRASMCRGRAGGSDRCAARV